MTPFEKDIEQTMTFTHKHAFSFQCAECKALANGTLPMGMCNLHRYAPELLELLKIYRSHHCGTAREKGGTICRKCEEADKIIAKAEGRP